MMLFISFCQIILIKLLLEINGIYFSINYDDDKNSRPIKNLFKSKYKHFLVSVVEKNLSQSFVKFLATIQHNLLDILKLIFPQLSIFQIQAINLFLVGQIRNDQLVLKVKFLFLICIN